MAKKEKMSALLWFRDNYKRTRQDGVVYYFTDLSKLLDNLLLGSGWYCLSKESIVQFQEEFANGNVKIATVGKNTNGNKESSNFETVADGEIFVRAMIKYDSVKDDFAVMDSNNRKTFWPNATYCKLENVRELTDNEKEIITTKIQQANSGLNIDKVFNLFGLLCSAKDVWTDYDEAKAINFYSGHNSWNTDKRERTYLGYDTINMFDPKDVMTKLAVCDKVAREAFRLTTALTGCELYLKDHPELDFVDSLMASRLLRNDDVAIKEVCKPTMTLKDLFEIVVGDKENKDFEVAAKLLLDQYIPAKKGHKNINKLLPTTGLTVLTINRNLDNIQMVEFKGLKHCVVWCVDECKEVYDVFLWDETAMIYEMAGNINNFLKIVNNK